MVKSPIIHPYEEYSMLKNDRVPFCREWFHFYKKIIIKYQIQLSYKVKIDECGYRKKKHNYTVLYNFCVPLYTSLCHGRLPFPTPFSAGLIQHARHGREVSEVWDLFPWLPPQSNAQCGLCPKVKGHSGCQGPSLLRYLYPWVQAYT